MENNLTENELFSLSCDFINLNRDITNDQIPSYLLESWSGDYVKTNEPNGLSLRVFFHILDLNVNPNENRSFYKSHQLFYIFQVIVATTIHYTKNRLRLCPVQIFRLDKYNIHNIEQSDILYTEYVKSVNPSVFRGSILRYHKKIKCCSPSDILITSKLSNLILIEQFIQAFYPHLFLKKSDLFERMSSCILATVKHSILYVNKDDNKCIKVILWTHNPFLKATVLCGIEDKEYKKNDVFSPRKPINKDDIKGHCLCTMKRLSDNILFLGNGKKVVLSFRH